MNIDWSVAIQYLPILLKGAVITLELTAGAVAMGVVIGMFMALAKLSHNSILKGIANVYIEFFRGTPLLVQIFLTYFGAPQLLHFQPPDNYQYIAGILAMGLNAGAYIAEIFRAGIQSIDRGQTEAARSLGMSQGQALRYIILPQAIKVVIPPLGNEFVAMLKDSSLVAVIAMEELFYSGKIIVGTTLQSFPIYSAVALIYLAMTMVISRALVYAERRMGKSDSRKRIA